MDDLAASRLFFSDDEFAEPELAMDPASVASVSQQPVVSVESRLHGWSSSDDSEPDVAASGPGLNAADSAGIAVGWSDSEDNLSEPPLTNLVDDVVAQMSPSNQPRKRGRPKKLSVSKVIDQLDFSQPVQTIVPRVVSNETSLCIERFTGDVFFSS